MLQQTGVAIQSHMLLCVKDFSHNIKINYGRFYFKSPPGADLMERQIGALISQVVIYDEDRRLKMYYFGSDGSSVSMVQKIPPSFNKFGAKYDRRIFSDSYSIDFSV